MMVVEWLPAPDLCFAMQSNAEQCRAMQSNAEQGRAMQSNAEQCRAMQSNAEQYYNIAITFEQNKAWEWLYKYF